MEFLYKLGYFGPIILFITVLILMIYTSAGRCGDSEHPADVSINPRRSPNKYLEISRCIKYFVIFYFLVMVFNNILKNIIKQPRPHGGEDIFSFEKYDKYGMPSGHSSSAMFSYIIAVLYFNNTIISVVLGMLLVLTLFQRIKYKKHNISQIVCGVFIGVISAFICYGFMQNSTSGLNLS